MASRRTANKLGFDRYNKFSPMNTSMMYNQNIGGMDAIYAPPPATAGVEPIGGVGQSLGTGGKEGMAGKGSAQAQAQSALTGNVSLKPMNTSGLAKTKQLPTDTKFLEPNKLNVGDKLKSGFEEATGFSDMSTSTKALGALTVGKDLIGGVQDYMQRGKNIDSLQDSVGDLSSAINNLTSEQYEGIKSLQQEFTEDRRKIGASSNMQLGNNLEQIRNRKNNLVSGSTQEMIDDVTDQYSTGADIRISDAYNRNLDMQSAFSAGIDNRRKSMTSQLEQLRAQLDQQKNAQKFAPLNTLMDVGISAVGMANPLLGAGLGALKQGVLDPYTT